MTAPAAAPPTFSSPQACRFAGLTYRRLDYWCRLGVFGARTPIARGSGSQRVWSRDLVHAATVCRRLTDAVTADAELPGLAYTPGPSSLPVSVLALAVDELAAHGWPVSGYLLACGDTAVHAPDVEGVAAVLDAGGSWIVVALSPDDRP